jgi:transposase InsO family protein
LSEALARFGKPGIFNTDQGAQFTSDEFTTMLRDHGIEISMDGTEEVFGRTRRATVPVVWTASGEE